MSDTDDLVQVTLIRAFTHLESFTPRREGAFLAYLRTILLNVVRDEIRRSVHRQGQEALREDIPDKRPWALEKAIGQQALESYENALARLSESQREAVILRVEFGFSHEEIARELGSPSANAARMLVTRALVRLSEAMTEFRGES
jgi:RNA polymerase sigma-70 factor (ECF subfamily)